MGQMFKPLTPWRITTSDSRGLIIYHLNPKLEFQDVEVSESIKIWYGRLSSIDWPNEKTLRYVHNSMIVHHFGSLQVTSPLRTPGLNFSYTPTMPETSCTIRDLRPRSRKVYLVNPTRSMVIPVKDFGSWSIGVTK